MIKFGIFEPSESINRSWIMLKKARTSSFLKILLHLLGAHQDCSYCLILILILIALFLLEGNERREMQAKVLIAIGNVK